MEKLDIRVSEQFIQMLPYSGRMGPIWTSHEFFKERYINHVRFVPAFDGMRVLHLLDLICSSVIKVSYSQTVLQSR